jgi:hypothetical protein
MLVSALIYPAVFLLVTYYSMRDLVESGGATLIGLPRFINVTAGSATGVALYKFNGLNLAFALSIAFVLSLASAFALRIAGIFNVSKWFYVSLVACLLVGCGSRYVRATPSSDPWVSSEPILAVLTFISETHRDLLFISMICVTCLLSNSLGLSLALPFVVLTSLDAAVVYLEMMTGYVPHGPGLNGLLRVALTSCVPSIVSVIGVFFLRRFRLSIRD